MSVKAIIKKLSSRWTQTAGMGAFSKETGWPHGPVKDTDPVFELEKQVPEQDSFPVRRVRSYICFSNVFTLF